MKYKSCCLWVLGCNLYCSSWRPWVWFLVTACFSPSFILLHNSIPMDTASNIWPLLNHVLKRRKPLGSGKVNHQPTRNTLGEDPLGEKNETGWALIRVNLDPIYTRKSRGWVLFTRLQYTHTCMLYHEYLPLTCNYLYFTLQAGYLDEQLSKTNSNYPYIALVQMDHSINMFLVIEREIVCETKSVFNSLQVFLASYFALLFIQNSSEDSLYFLIFFCTGSSMKKNTRPMSKVKFVELSAE